MHHLFSQSFPLLFFSFSSFLTVPLQLAPLVSSRLEDLPAQLKETLAILPLPEHALSRCRRPRSLCGADCRYVANLRSPLSDSYLVKRRNCLSCCCQRHLLIIRTCAILSS